MTSSIHTEPRADRSPLVSYLSADGRQRIDTWYAGTDVETTTVDPFAFLEDPDREDTQQWLVEQAENTADFFSRIPADIKRNAQESVLKVQVETAPLPNQFGEFTYQTRQKPNQMQPILYRYAKAEDINGEGRIILDPNEMDSTGNISINWHYATKDGQYIAYVASDLHAGTNHLRVRNTVTGEDLAENIPHTEYTYVSWLPDSTGFYYLRYPDTQDIPRSDPRYVRSAYFHKIGTKHEQDTLVYSTEDVQKGSTYVYIDPDGKYKIAGVLGKHGSTSMMISAFDNNRARERTVDDCIEVFNQKDTTMEMEHVGFYGGYLYTLKREDASNTTIVRLNLNNGIHEGMHDKWETVSVESAAIITQAQFIGDSLVINHLENAQSAISVVNMQTNETHALPIPRMSTASLDGTAGNDTAYVSIESFTTPAQIYAVNITTGNMTPVQQKETPFKPDEFDSQLVTYNSKDGTPVSMFLVQKKSAQAAGEKGLVLHVYGSFGRAMTPQYDPSLAALLDQGYILAVPHVRGGGEYGPQRAAEGQRNKKVNTYSDVDAACNYLIENQITTTKQLVLHGRSAGGGVAGTVLTQHPEHWGAVIVQAAPLDLLRFNLGGKGGPWTKEYGNPNNPHDFAYLRNTSPLHHVRNGVKYPPTLIIVGNKDMVVPPYHSYKFAAMLPNAQLLVFPGGHRDGIPKNVEMANDAAKLEWLNAQLR